MFLGELGLSSALTIKLTWSGYVLIPTFENHHEGIAILNEQECDPPPSFAQWFKLPTGTTSPYP
ncbi:hypothetical protein DPMN_055344 [Dreissena polymorpha]|uniref:Uncharacterized protein n=1 Tax=Dreissena polymorpha TaxID=45954 RepID=A0A9D4CR82_DREPO|nr:hypothetical protein DPMN_055344 [Dreissena polymorpha]